MVDHKCKLSHGKVNKEIVWRNNPYIANLFNVHNFGKTFGTVFQTTK